MTPPQPPADGTAGYRPSRRATLGLLGAVPLAASGLWALAGCAASASETPRSASVPAGLGPGGELDRLIVQLAAKDQFSGTVLVARGDRTVLSRAFGMADKARSIRNDQSTIFGLASVTKLFTAVAIAQLVQQVS
jgi:CubicO group peptidase (beta-lactamase class C family)